jgi:hypothetical protein
VKDVEDAAKARGFPERFMASGKGLAQEFCGLFLEAVRCSCEVQWGRGWNIVVMHGGTCHGFMRVLIVQRPPDQFRDEDDERRDAHEGEADHEQYEDRPCECA